MRALVVDDSRAMRRLLGRALATEGYEISEAAHGVAALEVVEADGPFDVVVTDWHMPEMDGLELVRALRSRPDTRATTIVMVTSEGRAEQITQALEAGADEYAMKPFTPDVLVAKLQLVRGDA